MTDITLGEVHRQLEQHIEFCEGQHKITADGIHNIQLTLATNQGAREAQTKAHAARSAKEIASNRKITLYIALASLVFGGVGTANLLKEILP